MTQTRTNAFKQPDENDNESSGSDSSDLSSNEAVESSDSSEASDSSDSDSSSSDSDSSASDSSDSDLPPKKKSKNDKKSQKDKKKDQAGKGVSSFIPHTYFFLSSLSLFYYLLFSFSEELENGPYVKGTHAILEKIKQYPISNNLSLFCLALLFSF